jgi:hypothetical protein
LIYIHPPELAEKNSVIAQLLCIDPRLPGAYPHFTSHLKNQPRAAAIGRKTFFCATLCTANKKPETSNEKLTAALPCGLKEFMKLESPWTVYRTRFVVRARQLTEPLIFTDALGREHSGQPGDYLVESSQGFRRITPCALFEDIYVPLDTVAPASRPLSGGPALSLPKGRPARPAGLDGSVREVSPVQRRPPLAAWSG